MSFVLKLSIDHNLNFTTDDNNNNILTWIFSSGTWNNLSHYPAT